VRLDLDEVALWDICVEGDRNLVTEFRTALQVAEDPVGQDALSVLGDVLEDARKGRQSGALVLHAEDLRRGDVLIEQLVQHLEHRSRQKDLVPLLQVYAVV